MIGLETKDGFIDFANIDFKCPFCRKKYSDINDKYLNKCNKNKSGKTFYMTYNYTGDATSFKMYK